MFNNVFRKSCRIWDNVEKYGAVREATNDVTVWSIRVACWISKTTCMHASTRMHTLTRSGTSTRAYTHIQICKTLLFHGNSGYVNAPQCHVIVHCLILIVADFLQMACCIIPYIIYWTMHGLIMAEWSAETGYLQVILLFLLTVLLHICIWSINNGNEML
jgi:hypothetical protein